MLVLRNAIVEQACTDYVKAKKFIIKNPNPILIDRKSEVNNMEWAIIRKNYKDGKLDFDIFQYYKDLHEKTLFKKRYINATFTVKDLTWWFGSKQFSNFNIDIDKETMLSKLDERCNDELREEQIKRTKAKKKCVRGNKKE